MHQRRRMLTDTLERIDKVVVRIDIMHTASRDQALDDPNLLGTKLCPTKNQFFLPMGIARRARSRWLVSIATSGSSRYTENPTWRIRIASKSYKALREVSPPRQITYRFDSALTYLLSSDNKSKFPIFPYSTVTLFAKFLGLSTSVPRARAVW